MAPRIGIGIGVGRFRAAGIPFADTALFWLDGTVSNGEFVDKTGNGRNFTITGSDFTSNYFPYKSAATISAPASDAVLIAADVNNFLYATDESPNEIPVVSFFQNIDYADTIFSRHVAQSVDGNGVETREPHVKDIAMYPAALTGSDLTTANSYYGVPTKATSNVMWVSKDGNDGNAGTEALPKLTIDAAQNAASAGDTVYVKSGDYDEIVYFDKSCTVQGIGFTQMIRTNHCFLSAAAAVGADCVVNGFIVETVVGYRPFYMLHAVNSFTANRCHLTNTTNTQAIAYTTTGGALTINDSILAKGNIQWSTAVTLNGCLFGDYGAWMVSALNTTNVNHCVMDRPSADNGGCLSIAADVTVTVFDSTWTRNIIWNTAHAWNYTFNIDRCTGDSNATGANFVFTNAAHTGTAIVSITNSTLNSTSTAGALVTATTDGDIVFNGNTINGLNGTLQFTGTLLTQTLECKNNTLTTDLTSNQEIFAESLLSDIQSNILYGGASSIRVWNDLASAQASIVKKNVIMSNSDSPSAAFIHVGIEGDVSTYGKSNGTVVSENVCYGPRYYSKNVGAQHGMFVYSQVIELKYNRVIGTFLGLVLKAAGASVATKSHHNSFIDCTSAWTIKGIKDVVVYNDIAVFTSLTDSVSTTALQHQEDDAFPGVSYSTGLLFKNNIIADYRTGDDDAFFATTTDDMVDSEYDYNIYYKVNGTAFGIYNSPSTITFASWQALPQDVNASQNDPELADPDNYDLSITSESNAAGAGATLDAAYDDGLDATTDWGNATTVPSVVTKQQTAPWDVGAYVS